MMRPCTLNVKTQNTYFWIPRVCTRIQVYNMNYELVWMCHSSPSNIYAKLPATDGVHYSFNLVPNTCSNWDVPILICFPKWSTRFSIDIYYGSSCSWDTSFALTWCSSCTLVNPNSRKILHPVREPNFKLGFNLRSNLDLDLRQVNLI